MAHLASGALVRVLEDWCPPFPGFFLYYPSRRSSRPLCRRSSKRSGSSPKRETASRRRVLQAVERSQAATTRGVRGGEGGPGTSLPHEHQKQAENLRYVAEMTPNRQRRTHGAQILIYLPDYKGLIWRRGWDSNYCWLLKTKDLANVRLPHDPPDPHENRGGDTY